MFISTKNRNEILAYFINKGVVVVEKDTHLAKNPDIPVPNLHVIKALQSLVSKDLATVLFNWQCYYFFINEAGIAYIRSRLHLPDTVVPETVAKATLPAASSTGRFRDQSMGGSGSFAGRRGERHEGAPKSAGHHEFEPKFEGRQRS